MAEQQTNPQLAETENQQPTKTHAEPKNFYAAALYKGAIEEKSQQARNLLQPNRKRAASGFSANPYYRLFPFLAPIKVHLGEVWRLRVQT